jgi:hypothetical protein
LKVGDVFGDNGEVRDTVYLAADQTKGDEANTVLVSKRLEKALMAYAATYPCTQPHLTQHCFLVLSAADLVRRQL